MFAVHKEFKPHREIAQLDDFVFHLSRTLLAQARQVIRPEQLSRLAGIRLGQWHLGERLFHEVRPLADGQSQVFAQSLQRSIRTQQRRGEDGGPQEKFHRRYFSRLMRMLR